MKTARRYLAKEIYRSTFAVLIVLLGLFMFFEMIDSLDNLDEKYTFAVMLGFEVMQIPSHLYDLLPIGMLIGAVIALASLAQRNELVILRVSGVSSKDLLIMLWIITIPITIFAALLSEVVTPYAESRSSAMAMEYLDKTTGARLDSGYWFKEPIQNNELRFVNVKRLEDHNNISGIRIYTFNSQRQFQSLILAKTGHFENNLLTLKNGQKISSLLNIQKDLVDPNQKTTLGSKFESFNQLVMPTSLTQKRLLASERQPDKMGISDLIDYINYLDRNQLQDGRQVVALWRKLAYPFTLFVMVTLAAPIGFVQTRKGGVGAKIFVGILLGVCFFMVNQLALNVGMLNNLPAWLTALLPNTLALLLACVALYRIEIKNKPKAFVHVK